MLNVVATTVLVSLVCAVSGQERRIIGGSDTSTRSHPHVVSITLWDGTDFDKSHHCGGSVIADTWVLTAAHCFHQENAASMRVIVDKDGTQKVYKVLDKKIHPLFDNNHVQGVGYKPNDIALLLTSEPIDNADYYKIDLPAKGDSFVGETCTIMGWGYTDDQVKQMANVLQATDGKILDDPTCANKVGVSYSPIFNICIQKDGTSGCAGDSGGPMVCNSRLAGVTSYGWCKASMPTVYTKVSNYIDWIETTTGLSC